MNRIPGRGRCSRTSLSRSHQFVGSVPTDFDRNVCAKPRVRLVLLCTFYPERFPCSAEALSERFCLRVSSGEDPGWLAKRESLRSLNPRLYTYTIYWSF
jgi:hypothetical protein